MSTLVDFFFKAWAFQKKNLQENLSYSYSYFFDFFEIVANLTIFFFIAKLLVGEENYFLAPYSGDYFAFVLIGVAFSGIQEASLQVYGHALGSEQSAGTLEAILITPTRWTTIMLAGAFWNFLFVFIRIAFYLTAGAVMFKAQFSFSPAALVILILSVAAMSGFGLISAGFSLIHKRGDPVSFFFSAASKLLAGVYFPITVLPTGIQSLAHFFPLTYTLSALRKSMLNHTRMIDLWPECLALIAFAAVLLPAGCFYFRYASTRARKDGSLTFV